MTKIERLCWVVIAAGFVMAGVNLARTLAELAGLAR